MSTGGDQRGRALPLWTPLLPKRSKRQVTGADKNNRGKRGFHAPVPPDSSSMMSLVFIDSAPATCRALRLLRALSLRTQVLEMQSCYLKECTDEPWSKSGRLSGIENSRRIMDEASVVSGAGSPLRRGALFPERLTLSSCDGFRRECRGRGVTPSACRPSTRPGPLTLLC